MKRKDYPNGASATMEKLSTSGMYLVEAWGPAGRLDRMRCDTYRAAAEYFRAFCRLAKAA